MLYCELESFSSEGSDFSASFATTTEHDVKPGETVVFIFDAKTVSDFEGIEPHVLPLGTHMALKTVMIPLIKRILSYEE